MNVLLSSGVYHPQDYNGPICPVVGYWTQVWQLSSSPSCMMRIRHCNKCVCDDEKFQDSRRHVNLSAIKNKINAKTIKKKKLEMNNHSSTWRTLRYNLLNCVTWYEVLIDQFYTQLKQLWNLSLKKDSTELQHNWTSYLSPQFKYTIFHMFNSQSDQLPAGLIAQLVEHCIGNAEVMGLKSRSDLSLFSDLNFTIAFMYNCDDQAWLHDVYWSLLPRSSLRWQYKNLGAFFTADYGRELKASKVTFRWNVNYTWYKRQLRLEVLLTCQVFSARCSRAHRVCTAYAPRVEHVLCVGPQHAIVFPHWTLVNFQH